MSGADGEVAGPGAVERGAHLLRRSGLFVTRALRSLWIHVGTIEDFERASPLVAALTARFPASHCLFTSARPETCGWLRPRQRAHRVVPPPWPWSPLTRRFFAELDPVILFWIELDRGLPGDVVRAARARGLPVVGVLLGSVPEAAELRRATPLVDVFVVADEAAAAPLRAAGAREVRVAVGEDAAERGAAAIRELEPRLERLSVRTRDVRFHRRRRTRAFTESPLGRWLAAVRTGRRIAGWEALRERLGSPRTILCLGNGPSSEDPRVLDVAHDCLMRVNRRWLGRGFLERPHVVFVGALDTTIEVPPTVFVFRGLRKEREVLLRHLVLGRRLAPVEYFTLECEGSLLDEREWGAKPTNGAVMIATAVALRPRRIVIAGIDLFDHPDGAYPGDRVSANEYFRGHERDVEIEILRHVLARFDGELIVLSPVLERALRAGT